MPGRVLVTDGHFRHCLAVVRSLGSKGLIVHCASSRRNAASFHSRHCSRPVFLPDPAEGEPFVSGLCGLLEGEEYDALIPVGLRSAREISRNIDRIGEASEAAIPLPGPESMEVACRKDLTLDVAGRLGLRVPATITPRDVDDVLAFANEVGYPIVAKAVLGSGARQVSYLGSADGVQEAADAFGEGVMVQEYVLGPGMGYFALMREGRALAEFCHRRIHEMPRSGGPSTKAVGVECPGIVSAGRRILAELGWTGVAMAEFKMPPGGPPVLLELNPKFWGSLDLAIASGVDFPYLDYLMAAGREFPPPVPRTGVVFRWLGPDMAHCLDADPARSLVGYFLDFLRPGVVDDLRLSLALDDLAPVRYLTRSSAGSLSRKLTGG